MDPLDNPDPHIITWQIARPLLQQLPLVHQPTGNLSLKEWLIKQLHHAMTNNDLISDMNQQSNHYPINKKVLIHLNSKKNQPSPSDINKRSAVHAQATNSVVSIDANIQSISPSVTLPLENKRKRLKETLWHWPMSKTLPNHHCAVYNPPGDGNCFYWCLLEELN